METKETMMEKLIADPSSALREAFNVDVPDDFNVVVHEDDAQTVHSVLPASAESTDSQLQQAAGGAWCGEPTWY